MKDKYEKDEAVAILGRAYGSTRQSEREREKAVVELMDAVLGLNGVAGLEAKRIEGREDIRLTHGDRSVLFGWHGDAFNVWREHRFFRKVEQVTDIPLSYDGALGRFESLHEDTFHVPTPGSARARRSALAVIVETALHLMALKDPND